MLWLQTNKTGSGTMNLGGSLTRQASCKSQASHLSTIPNSSIDFILLQVEQDSTINDQSPHTHIANIGRMVEDMENKIRNTLNEIYFSKTKDIVNGLRSIQSLSDQKAQAAMKQDLAAALQRRNLKNEN